ncbi:Ig-like domain-containing protein [Streptomyces albidoflavus]
MSHTPRIRTVLSCTVLVVALGAGATACGSSETHPLAAAPYDAAQDVAISAGGRTKADPDKPLEVTATGKGRLTDVVAVDASGRRAAGELSADGTRWRTTGPLAAAARYTVTASTENGDGGPGRRTMTFDTAAQGKGKDKRLKVTFGPEKGTYGVGQPIVAELNAPVEDRKARAVVENSLKVTSKPAVETGGWYWVDSKTLHYRPKEYWPANATVTARSELGGVRVTDKVRGAAGKPLTIRTGSKIEAVVDASRHAMTVFKDGEELTTLPVTTGKPGFATRNGVKVVLGKEYFVRMRGTSVGIAAGSSESYDLPVYYATRVTWSGEYVHAAPWSVGSHGSANVSHGCVGMSTKNAAWFFETVREGDLVHVVNSIGEDMDPFGNGFGDWNVDWADWKAGSANAPEAPPGKAPGPADRLSPRI